MKNIVVRIETVLVLVVAWGLVFLLPFRWTKRLFGGLDAPHDDGLALSEEALRRPRMIARRLNRIADRLPWTSTCLVRALAGRILLANRGLHGGRVRVGLRRDGDVLAAHAWLILGTTVLLGGDVAADYQAIADLSR